jgi:DNA-binding response OmpR family regulator
MRPPPAPSTVADSLTILVVVDDSLVRGMVRRALREAGFQVIEAANGQAALLVMQPASARVETVLTDLALPRSLAGKPISPELLTRKMRQVLEAAPRKT